jgi:excisionase family DNA binding protein
VHRDREWFTVDELREWLGLGRTKAHELVASGEIPSYRIGRLRRIKKADVERYLETRRYDPKGVTPSNPLDAEDGGRPRGGSA